MNPVPTSPLANDLATAPSGLVTEWYRDANPVPTSPLADDLATAPSRLVHECLKIILYVLFRFYQQVVLLQLTNNYTFGVTAFTLTSYTCYKH